MKKTIFTLALATGVLLVSCKQQQSKTVVEAPATPLTVTDVATQEDYSKIFESYVGTGSNGTTGLQMANYLETTYGTGYVDAYNQIKNDPRLQKSQARLDNSDGVLTESEIIASVNELGLSEYGSSRLVELYSLLDDNLQKLDSLYALDRQASILLAKSYLSTYRQSIINDNNLVISEKNSILVAIKAYEDNLEGILSYYETPSVVGKNLRVDGLGSVWRKVKTVAVVVGGGALLGAAIGVGLGGAQGAAIGAAAGGVVGLVIGIEAVANNNCTSNKCPNGGMDCNTGKCK